MKEELAFLRLGQRVKELREKQDITQLAFSESTGIDIHTQNQLEKGKYNPSIIELIQISGFYNLSLSEFFADFE
jgi:transcriptional regulator with XRE-family HTH domain